MVVVMSGGVPGVLRSGHRGETVAGTARRLPSVIIARAPQNTGHPGKRSGTAAAAPQVGLVEQGVVFLLLFVELRVSGNAAFAERLAVGGELDVA